MRLHSVSRLKEEPNCDEVQMLIEIPEARRKKEIWDSGTTRPKGQGGDVQ